MTKPTPDALLSLIIRAETSKGFDDYSTYAKIKPPKPVTEMTVNEVLDWQRRAVAAGSESVAVGGFQMVGGTFRGVVKEMGLTGDEVFDANLQRQMGRRLLVRRGYNDWVAGKITDRQFHQNLSQEWAGLPAATEDKRGRKAQGQSYHAGDGLNASTVKTSDVIAALNASRNGETFEFAPAGPGGANIGGGGSTSAPSQYDLALSDFEPMEGYTEEQVKRVAETPVSAYRSFVHDKAIAQEQEEAAQEKPSFWEATKMAFSEEQIFNNVARQVGREDFAFDPNFEMTDDLWDELTDGLGDVYQEGLGDAKSEAHAREIAKRLKHEQDVDSQLASLGWGGVGLRLTAAVFDPVALGVSVATEGLAAPFIYGAKVGRVGRALRAGTAAGAVNAGIDGYLATQDQTMGWDDVAISAAAGFVLGGAIGGLRGRTPEDAAMADALQRDVIDGEADNVARAAASPYAGGEANGSIGAARVEQEVEQSAAEQVAAESASAPTTAFSKARLDRSAVLKSSEIDTMRRVGGGLVEDGVGNADNSVNRHSVSESVAREERVRNARFYRVYNAAYKEWLKEQGKRMFWQHGAGERAEFNKMVSLAVRRELDAPNNKHVAKVAGQMKKEFADLLKFGKEMGVRGFDEVAENYNYMVRRHRIDRLDELVGEFGKGNINRLVADSIQKANRKWRNANPGRAMAVDEIDYEDALKIADSYVKSIRSRRYGEFNLNRALAGQDIETLKMMLEDAGMAADDITRISDKVRFQVDSGETGRIASAKWRLDLDETHRVKMFDKNGVERSVGIEDFLENDAEQLFGQYTRSVVAAGYMEDFLKEFRVRDAEGNLPAYAPSFDTVKAYIAEEAQSKGISGKQFHKEMQVLDNTYKLINGIPIESPSDFRAAQRMLRDYNFSRIGGQLGIAQLAEVGNILGNGGLRVLMQNIPALRRIFVTAKNDKFSDDFLNEIEAIWGFGTDLERMNMAPIFDEGGAAEAATGWQKTDHFLQRSKKVTAVGSGMAHINMVLQRLNARVLVQRFMDDAKGIRDINPRRLSVMGISEELHPRIQEQLRKHVDESTGMLGRKVKRINIEKWDDLEAKNAFINGVDRWAKKSVQENDIGNMPDFMSYELGKTIGQFRSFMMAAYVKQTLAGMHMRDWETASAFLGSMFFGGLFYVGQTHVNSLGRDDREQYLEDRLNPTNLANAAFQRAAFSSVIPMTADIVGNAMGFDPTFDFRSSGLKSGGATPSELILSNPTGDLVDGASRAFGGVVQGAINPDYTFSEQDFKGIAKVMMFQNMFGVRNVLAAVGGELPDYSQ